AQSPARAAPGPIHVALQRPGRPLEAPVKSAFEDRFGADFSAVRIHTDGPAALSARALQARAYTFGRDIVFAAGEYVPASQGGRRLIAHELTHVLQQGQADEPHLARAPDSDTGP